MVSYKQTTSNHATYWSDIIPNDLLLAYSGAFTVTECRIALSLTVYIKNMFFSINPWNSTNQIVAFCSTVRLLAQAGFTKTE